MSFSSTYLPSSLNALMMKKMLETPQNRRNHRKSQIIHFCYCVWKKSALKIRFTIFTIWNCSIQVVFSCRSYSQLFRNPLVGSQKHLMWKHGDQCPQSAPLLSPTWLVFSPPDMRWLSQISVDLGNSKLSGSPWLSGLFNFFNVHFLWVGFPTHPTLWFLCFTRKWFFSPAPGTRWKHHDPPNPPNRCFRPIKRRPQRSHHIIARHFPDAVLP